MNAKIRKLLAVLVGVLCSLTAMFALAGEWSGKTLINRITGNADQTVFVFNKSGTWKNPDLCDSDKKIVLLPPGAEGGALAYKEIYASLLSAHIADRKIRAYLDGCASLGNKSFPALAQVSVH